VQTNQSTLTDVPTSGAGNRATTANGLDHPGCAEGLVDGSIGGTETKSATVGSTPIISTAVGSTAIISTAAMGTVVAVVAPTTKHDTTATGMESGPGTNNAGDIVTTHMYRGGGLTIRNATPTIDTALLGGTSSTASKGPRSCSPSLGRGGTSNSLTSANNDIPSGTTDGSSTPTPKRTYHPGKFRTDTDGFTALTKNNVGTRAFGKRVLPLSRANTVVKPQSPSRVILVRSAKSQASQMSLRSIKRKIAADARACVQKLRQQKRRLREQGKNKPMPCRKSPGRHGKNQGAEEKPMVERAYMDFSTESGMVRRPIQDIPMSEFGKEIDWFLQDLSTQPANSTKANGMDSADTKDGTGECEATVGATGNPGFDGLGKEGCADNDGHGTTNDAPTYSSSLIVRLRGGGPEVIPPMGTTTSRTRSSSKKKADVSSLMELCYSWEQAEYALSACHGNVDRAANMLLAGPATATMKKAPSAPTDSPATNSPAATLQSKPCPSADKKQSAPTDTPAATSNQPFSPTKHNAMPSSLTAEMHCDDDDEAPADPTAPGDLTTTTFRRSTRRRQTLHDPAAIAFAEKDDDEEKFEESSDESSDEEFESERVVTTSKRVKKSAAVASKKRRSGTAAASKRPQKQAKSQSAVVAKLPRIHILSLSPIVFQALKHVIDRFNKGTNSIVDVKGFVAECRRIASSHITLDAAILDASVLLRFPSGTMNVGGRDYPSFSGTGQYDGHRWRAVKERYALKNRLTKIAGCPQCKCMMDDACE